MRDHGRVSPRRWCRLRGARVGVREVIGLDVGEVEWARSGSSSAMLKQRGLDGVRLVISDQHDGLKAAIARVLGCCGSAALSISCATW